MHDDILRPSPIDLEKELDVDSLQLYLGVLASLRALPASFSFSHSMSGIKAIDLFNLNMLLGAAIEDQVVKALNSTRSLWDPMGKWEDCVFVRRSQSFPDVRLVRRSFDGVETIMGIELKGWYVLSKESVPSMRYQIAPAACAPMDLVCVVPWYLDNAVSGEPRVLTPWVEQARYAAEWRDYWWEYVRGGRGAPERKRVIQPENVGPYPSKSDFAHAVPVHDAGDNFGRLPRCRPLMDSFIDETLSQEILGIPIRDWIWFIGLHKDTANPEDVSKQLKGKIQAHDEAFAEEEAEKLVGLLRRLQCEFDFGD